MTSPRARHDRGVVLRRAVCAGIAALVWTFTAIPAGALTGAAICSSQTGGADDAVPCHDSFTVAPKRTDAALTWLQTMKQTS